MPTMLVDEDLKVDGNTTIGTGNSDSLKINADLVSNITPDADDTYYLGNTSRGFKNIYAQEITIKEKIKTDDIEIDGSLNHDGSFVGFYGASPIARPNVFIDEFRHEVTLMTHRQQRYLD